MSTDYPEGHIETLRNARHFMSSSDYEMASELWIVLHGYGQSALHFLKKFQPLFNQNRLIVAPEGMHRFYNEGYSGRVGASWMTREDRLTDIQDNDNYLDNVYSHFAHEKKWDKIVVLGFSQGGATATRWICHTRKKVDQLILWAASFPQDLQFPTDAEKLNTIQLNLILGDNDEFISETDRNNLFNYLKEKGVAYSYQEFQGPHDIDAKTLLSLSTER